MASRGGSHEHFLPVAVRAVARVVAAGYLDISCCEICSVLPNLLNGYGDALSVVRWTATLDGQQLLGALVPILFPPRHSDCPTAFISLPQLGSTRLMFPPVRRPQSRGQDVARLSLGLCSLPFGV